MHDLLRDSPPQPPPPIDSFLAKPSKLEGFYTLILLSSGGVILGHTIATLPAFRGVAIAIAIAIALTLAAWIGYPKIQDRVSQSQHLGTHRLYPGSKGKPGLINQSIALAMLAPGLALAGLMLLGILLAWI